MTAWLGIVAGRSTAALLAACRGFEPCTEQIFNMAYRFFRVWLFVYIFSVYVNAPTIQELFLVWDIKKEMVGYNLSSSTRKEGDNLELFSDGVDGKQARRIGVSGPLGELFDHGLDSYIVFLIPYSLISVYGRDPVFSVSCFR